MPERWQWSRPTGRHRPARTNPYDGAVRPPSPPHAASHRRGKILSTFRDLGIFPETAEALEAVGIISPFPIQELTLPVALSGNDVIGQAKTGTGKTLGFGLPLLERVTVPADVEAGRARPEQLTDAPQALVVVPTRELCQQVTNDLLTAGKVRNVRVLAIYGGRAYEPQVEALKKGVDVVVGTPGRLLDLAGQRKLDLSQVKSLVLDEADEMLDLGFLPDVEKIIQHAAGEAPDDAVLRDHARPGHLASPAATCRSPRTSAPPRRTTRARPSRNTKQHVFRAHSMDKPEMVSRILQAEGRGLAMVFCRTKRTAADIADQLARRGFASGAVHGDLGQGAREQALRAFRNGKVDVLVCTDVAARGIDVEGVTHVINYQSPEDEKTYLHRIGRTGRAGAKGTAVTLVDWDDIPRWKLINKALDLAFDEPEETYSTSPHLYEQLNIPAGTKGVLPRTERTRAGLAAEEVEDLGETGGRGRGPRKAAAVVEEERPPRTRTPRQRRRTRGGTPTDGPAAEAPKTGSPAAAEGTEDAEATGPRQPRRRRRTRGSQTTGAAVVAAPAAEAPAAAVVATEAPAEPAKPRRRRPRITRPEDTGTFQTVEVAASALAAQGAAVAAEAAAVTEPAEAPATPRRRTRSAAKAAAATAPASVTETVTDAAVEAPAKPKRTRKSAAAKAAEAVVDTAEAAVEAPAKPKRTRKAAAAKPAAESAVDTAEGTVEAPAKPKRTRKTAAAAKSTADAPAAEDAPAKPKRTRKSAAATAAEATDTAEAKPVRRRTRAKAPAAEATPES